MNITINSVEWPHAIFRLYVSIIVACTEVPPSYVHTRMGMGWFSAIKLVS